MVGEMETAGEREAFEQWMRDEAKCIVGSSDPYPAGLERDYWKVWRARASREAHPVAPPVAFAKWLVGQEYDRRMFWIAQHGDPKDMAWTSEVRWSYLYAAPQEPVAPDPNSLQGNLIGRAGFNFAEHLLRQATWSAQTFGPGARVDGVTDHITKELREVRDSNGCLTEWVDVVILALDGCWRSGATPEQIIDAIVAKQAKNEGRKWPDWRTVPAGKAIEHDRSHDAAPTHAPSPDSLGNPTERAGEVPQASISSPSVFYPNGIAHLQPTIRVAVITFEGSSVTVPVNEVATFMEGEGPYTVAIKEMARREFEALPEFNGW